MEPQEEELEEEIENALVVRESNLTLANEPNHVNSDAIRASKALLQVIENKEGGLWVKGKRHIEFTEWQLIANYYNVTVFTSDPEDVIIWERRGVKATGEAIHVPTGNVVGRATAYAFTNEKGKGHYSFNQLSSLAQTRAGSKALRNALGWVLELGKIPTTPAEEFDEYDQQAIQNGKKIEVQNPTKRKATPKKNPPGNSQEFSPDDQSREAKLARAKAKLKKKKPKKEEEVVEGEFTVKDEPKKEEKPKKKPVAKKEPAKKKAPVKKSEKVEAEEVKDEPAIDPEIKLNVLMKTIEDRCMEAGYNLKPINELKIATVMLKENEITQEQYDTIKGRLGYKKK